MESAVISPSSNRFGTHLKNAASALWTRTLPKQRRSGTVSASSPTKHHTYPRATQPKRTALSCGLEPHACETSSTTQQVTATTPESDKVHYDIIDVDMSFSPNYDVKLKGTLSREVATAWGSRVGPPDHPAPADRIQSLFNDIELYPTKTQVFEMLVCARQCAKRKSLTLTFGEFCVFAAELRKCSRQARQTPTKPESPQWSTDKETTCKHVNGSEASPPPCEVFLGGSCNPTTWRSDIAIPILNKMGITYFNPQVEDWSTELMEVEHRAKAAARALLFVLDSETRAVAASVEAAYLAAAPRDLLLVLRPYARRQHIGGETISDQEYMELSRARATLQEAVERRGLPAFTDIPAALRCARAVVRGARTYPRHSLGHTILRLKRAFDAAGGRAGALARPRALEALGELLRAPADRVERCLPPAPDVDFESFCTAVAELAADSESEPVASRRCAESPRADPPPLHSYNARLRACGRKLGLIIPKSPGSPGSPPATSLPSPGSAVLTPGTERRLQRLPAMVKHTHDLYVAGTFPSGRRPEDVVRSAGHSCVCARANDYTRMFSASARRPAQPPADKRARPDQDRLSASDFYTVSQDHTPQPFKGTYDEDLIMGARVVLFSMSADSPNFAVMVLAAHYVGLRPHNAVLLVQPMDAAKASTYSESALKDYNRGRHYLRDLARRVGVPVHDEPERALDDVLARLQH